MAVRSLFNLAHLAIRSSHLSRMGNVLGRASCPQVESVRAGDGSEEPFDAPLSVHIQLKAYENAPALAAWRVQYEMDVAHLQKEVSLLEIAPRPLADDGGEKIDLPGIVFAKLLDMHGVNAVCNVSALTVAMHADSLAGRELMSLTAVVEVYHADSSSMIQTGQLCRRVYVQPPSTE